MVGACKCAMERQHRVMWLPTIAVNLVLHVIAASMTGRWMVKTDAMKSRITKLIAIHEARAATFDIYTFRCIEEALVGD